VHFQNEEFGKSTLLFSSAAGLNSSVGVAFLIDKQADVNLQDFRGFIPLNFACCLFGHKGIVKIPLDYKQMSIFRISKSSLLCM
jgi:hypothetical protein